MPILDKNRLESPLKPKFPAGPGASLAWSGLAGSGRGLAIAAAAENHGGPLLVVTASSFSAQRVEDEIRFYTPARSPLFPLVGRDPAFTPLHGDARYLEALRIAGLDLAPNDAVRRAQKAF